MNIELKNHWEKVYMTKEAIERSWTQETPVTSLDFIHELDLPKKASIIDIGGGDSRLVDRLLDEGYLDITVLDISSKALEKTQARLGSNARKIKWLVCNVLDFRPEQQYDLWHDRATFHFLTEREDIGTYVDIAHQSIRGFLIMASFSDQGPEKCSGLEVRRYSESLLQDCLSKGFDKIRCVTEDHITPFNTRQNFLFCSFKKTTERLQ